MKVEELFLNFTAYFDKIIFYDTTENIQDAVYIRDNNNDDYNENMYDEFLEQYGDYKVTDWEYVYHGNYIDITIEE